MMAEQDKADTIKTNLEIGKQAKPKMYNSLVQRIASGEVLHGKELETFEKLDAELRKEYESAGGPSPGTLSHNGTVPAPEYLNNVLAVSVYLKSKGYKVGKSTIYNHRSEGLIRPNKDGLFLVADVDKYAKKELPLADGTVPVAKNIDKAQKDKADAATREKLARARHWELRTGVLEQKLIPRETAADDLAARLAILKSDIYNFWQVFAPEMVHVVVGDPAKIPDLISYGQDASDQWLARYSQKEEFTIDAAAYEKIFDKADKDEIDDGAIEENE